MKICLALDAKTMKENIDLVKQLKGYPLWLKVGFRSFLRDNWNFLEELRSIDSTMKIFLDLKLYDIPNTMADGAEEITQKKLCDMFNIHASSGEVAMQEVMKRLKHYEERPLVLAVTALTSFNEDNFRAIYHQPIQESATMMAKLAHHAGIDGVVCSAHESLLIKSHTSRDFLTLCPGIRPFGEESHDQSRIADIDYALSQSVDFAVIGRPIYESKDPLAVVEKIFQKLS